MSMMLQRLNGSLAAREDAMERTIMLVGVITATLISTVNAFILLVLITNWNVIQRQCRNRACLLITCNLCSADLFLGLICIYYILSLRLDGLHEYLGQHKILCVMTLHLVIMVYMASGFTLVSIALERYIYILYPLRHTELLNTRRTFLMISTVWTAAFLGSCPLQLWNNWEDGRSNVCDDVHIIPITYSIIGTTSRVVFITVVITVFHWRVHRVAIEVRNRKTPMSTITALRTRSARVVLIIFFTYVGSSAPFLVMLLCIKYDIYVPPICFQISRCVYNINYIVNPFVYIFCNRSIGHIIFQILKTWKAKYIFWKSRNREEAHSTSPCVIHPQTSSSIRDPGSSVR
ncbi:G-protein coupled receptor 3 [Anabrus simplex]|uniref:G-protein coupled receptor 3 n=1 Tax=Anabrus simplex TaxID=316456 RepID=UPI0035A2CFF6